MGGRVGWSIVLITSVVAGGCLLLSLAARRSRLRVRFHALVWVSLLALGFTGLQALPLPVAITAALQPLAVERATAMATLLGEPAPGWVALSLAPRETLAALTKGVAISCALMGSWILVARGQRKRLFIIVGASAAAMAVVALGHFVLGVRDVYGIVETASPLPGPLINPNHLSGFLALGVPVLIGLGLELESPGARLTAFGLAVVTGVAALMSFSRGGLVSLAIGILLLALLGIARRRSGTGARGFSGFAAVAATLALTAGFGLYLAAEGIFRDFEAGDSSKLELAARGLGVALDHPWVGVGRGAFSAAFVSHHGTALRFTHPENFLAQWVSEWGFPLGLSLLGTLTISLVRGVREARDWTRLAGVAASIALGAHELVDFATEGLGVAVVATVCVVASAAPRHRRQETDRGSWRVPFATALLAFCFLATFGWRIDGSSVPQLRAELEDALRSGHHERFAATLSSAARLHPSEPIFTLLSGAEAVRRGSPEALPWLNRTMVLAPGWDAPHVEAAMLFSRMGRHPQAFAEMRAAETLRAGSAWRVACDSLLADPSRVDAFLAASRADPTGLILLENTARCLPLDSGAGQRIDETLVEHDVLGSFIRRAQRLMNDGEPAAAYRSLAPVSDSREAGVHEMRARALIAQRLHREAAEVANVLAGSDEQSDELLRLRATALAGLEDADAMRRTLEQLRISCAGQTVPLARVWMLQGRLEAGLGNDGRAFQAYERAARLDPSSDGLLAAAQLAERLGRWTFAHQTYARLCLERSHPTACEARDRVSRQLREHVPSLEQLTGAP